MYKELLDSLIVRYPVLTICRENILNAFQILKAVFTHGNKLLIAGNGGSAAGCEHITGELLKSFRFKRAADPDVSHELVRCYGEDGAALAAVLEGSLPVIPLPSISSLYTAFVNDADPSAVFAQMICGLGSSGDALLAISTSGNSENILSAVMTANAKKMKTIGLTGLTGGKLKDFCNITICVPASETYEIQELHVPIYHSLCAMLEAELFKESLCI